MKAGIGLLNAGREQDDKLLLGRAGGDDANCAESISRVREAGDLSSIANCSCEAGLCDSARAGTNCSPIIGRANSCARRDCCEV